MLERDYDILQDSLRMTRGLIAKLAHISRVDDLNGSDTAQEAYRHQVKVLQCLDELKFSNFLGDKGGYQ